MLGPDFSGLSVAEPSARYRVYFDGGCRPNPGTGGCGGGFYILGYPPQLFSMRLGRCTSNLAEYLGLVYALRLAKQEDGVGELDVIGDSELVIRQMKGEYAVNDTKLSLLHEVACGLAAKFQHVNYFHVPRSKNTVADKLASEGIDMELENQPRNFLCYYPSLASHCSVTVSGFGDAFASNDLGVSRSDGLNLMDAAFLRQLPGGQAALRSLSALTRTSDGSIKTDALNVVTARCASMNILGYTSTPIDIVIRSSQPNVPSKRTGARFVVVLDLPLPMHISCQQMRLFDDSHVKRGLDGTQFPEPYRAHEFWHTDTVLLPF